MKPGYKYNNYLCEWWQSYAISNQSRDITVKTVQLMRFVLQIQLTMVHVFAENEKIDEHSASPKSRPLYAYCRKDVRHVDDHVQHGTLVARDSCRW